MRWHEFLSPLPLLLTRRLAFVFLSPQPSVEMRVCRTPIQGKFHEDGAPKLCPLRGEVWKMRWEQDGDPSFAG